MSILAACAWLLTWRLWARSPADRLMIGGPDGDFARQFVGFRIWVADAWSSLRPPLWNPYQYAGTPGWADPQMAVLYPFRAVQAVIAGVLGRLPLAAVTAEVPIHLVLAGAFTYFLVRRLGARPAAAAFAGVTFLAGGYLTGYPIEQLPVLVTAAWVPGVLWAVCVVADEAPGRRRSGYVLVAGVVTAGMLSAGHPQTALYGLIWAVAWAIERGRRGPDRRGGLAAALAGIAFGVALSAAAWLPAAALAGHLARDLSPAEQLAGFAPGELVGALLPHSGGRWWPLWVGTAGLGFAVTGVFARAAWFWLGSAAIALLVTMGGRLPVLPALLETVPGLSLFRHHERAAVVVSLGLAIAAGLALEALLTGSPEKRHRTSVAFAVAGLAALAAGLALSGRAVQPGTTDDFAMLSLAALAVSAVLATRHSWAVAVVAALELVSVNEGHGMTPWFDPFPPVPAIATLADDPAKRVSSEGQLPGGANAAMVHGLRDVTGDSPFHLAAIDALQADVPELVWWRLLNVGWVTTARTFAPGAPLERTADLTPPVGLYRVLVDAAPVWLAPEAGLDITAMTDPAFDPGRGAPLSAEDAAKVRTFREGLIARSDGAAEDAPAAPPPSGDVSALPAGGLGRVRLTGLGAFRAAAEAELEQPAMVVLSTAYAPGWRARAQGPNGTISPPVVAAYGALVASPLPAGRWAIRWTYLPTAVILGLAVTVLSAAAGGVFWLRTRAASSP